MTVQTTTVTVCDRCRKKKVKRDAVWTKVTTSIDENWDKITLDLCIDCYTLFLRWTQGTDIPPKRLISFLPNNRKEENLIKQYGQGWIVLIDETNIINPGQLYIKPNYFDIPPRWIHSSQVTSSEQ